MNRSVFKQAITIAVLMVLAGGLAFAAKPRVKVAELGPKVDLEALIPRQFGEWTLDAAMIPVHVNPEVQAKIDKLYAQTLARTYVNPRGDRVMLSIAYGGDQSDTMQVHKPEVCYPAQGFEVIGEKPGRIGTELGVLPVKHVIARMGARNEPITYWIVVGDRATAGGLSRKLAQLSYGFTGKIPDGMLVRLSSIDRDAARAFELHARYTRDLLNALDAGQQVRFVGRLGG